MASATAADEMEAYLAELGLDASDLATAVSSATSASAIETPTPADGEPKVDEVKATPKMNLPPGLSYHANAISAKMAQELLAWLKANKDWFAVSTGPNSRQVLHYGYAYNYRSGAVNKPALAFPEIIERLCATIAGLVELPEGYTFNQCIINRYLPGQGIGAHTDAAAYGEFIACFTVGGGAEMEFEKGTAVKKLYTEPRSLYVMSGDARRKWTHTMRGRNSDPGHGSRATRYSITFRSVKS